MPREIKPNLQDEGVNKLARPQIPIGSLGSSHGTRLKIKPLVINVIL